MSIIGRTNKDEHNLVMPPKGILDLTPLSSKQGKFLIGVSSKQRKRKRGLISIIKEFLNR